jgi:hypothetical protein
MRDKKFLVMSLFLFVNALMLSAVLYKVSEPAPAPEVRVVTRVVTKVVLSDENTIIEGLIENGKYDTIVNFYDTFVKNVSVTRLIVNTALSNHIPVHLFFALAWQESVFDPACVSYNKKSGKRPSSWDISLFQLNTLSYPNYSIRELANINTNCRLAADRMRENFERYGSWEESLIGYNGGNINVVYSSTIKHLARVLYYRDLLNRSFYTEFCV